MLFVAAVWYLVIVSLFSMLQLWVERRVSRGISSGVKP
jgi:polar amino acid transport system permease protein